jgi:hypothetical protein
MSHRQPPCSCAPTSEAMVWHPLTAAHTPLCLLPPPSCHTQAAPLDICGPCNSESIVWHPVTPAMSKPGYQNPAAATDIRKKKGAITSFFKAAPSPAKPKAAAAAAAKGTKPQETPSPAKPKAAAAAAKGTKSQETPSPAEPKAAVQQQGPVKQEDGSSKEQQKQQGGWGKRLHASCGCLDGLREGGGLLWSLLLPA